MSSLVRRPWFIAAVLVVAAASFWAFRPDTLFLDSVVDESLDDAFGPTTTVVATEPPASTTTPSDPGPTTTTTTEAVGPVEPTVVSMGAFVGIDHQATGTAAIYTAEGRSVLRFEGDTDIQNGPDLYVWLVPAPGYESGTPEAFLDLGLLKGNVGAQNYELPDDFDPDGDWTVLIWCRRFATPFAAAPLM